MAKIPTRQLGKNGPQVSAIGFGAMGISVGNAPPGPDEERFKVYDRAIELGSTYFDTADIYGDSEDLLGRYFQKYPQQRTKVRRDNSHRKKKTFFHLIGISCNKICQCYFS